MRDALPGSAPDCGESTKPPTSDPVVGEVYRLRTHELLDELADVQAQLRRYDPSGAVLDEGRTPDPAVVDLIHEEYRIIRELRARQRILRQSIEWLDSRAAPDSSAPLVRRIDPPQPVQVDHGGQRRPAQLEGVEVTRNGGGAYVRFIEDGSPVGAQSAVTRVPIAAVWLPA